MISGHIRELNPASSSAARVSAFRSCCWLMAMFDALFGGDVSDEISQGLMSQDSLEQAVPRSLQSYGIGCESDEEEQGQDRDQIPLAIAAEPCEDHAGDALSFAVGSRVDGVEVFASSDFAKAQKIELQLLRSTIEASTAKQLQMAYPASKLCPGHGIVCPLCPKLQVESGWKKSLLRHLDEHHCPGKGRERLVVGGERLKTANFTASGSKQLRVMTTLFDHDRLVRRERFDYLARSAAILRARCGDVSVFNDRCVGVVTESRDISFGPVAAIRARPAQYLRVGCTTMSPVLSARCFTRSSCSVGSPLKRSATGSFSITSVWGAIWLNTCRMRRSSSGGSWRRKSCIQKACPEDTSLRSRSAGCTESFSTSPWTVSSARVAASSGKRTTRRSPLPERLQQSKTRRL